MKIKKEDVEYSCRNSDDLVFEIKNGEESKIYVCLGPIYYNNDGAEIQLCDCHEVDDSCLEGDGSYIGDFLPESMDIYLQNPYQGNENLISTVYYEEDINMIINP